MLLDRRCPGCSIPSSSICRSCRERLRSAAFGVGGSGFSGQQPIEAPPGLDSLTAALTYDQVVARLILAAKNGGRRDLLRLLGRDLGLRIEPTIERVGMPHIVTWVPASRSRRTGRGYDQGQILARTVARSLGIRSRRLLARRRGEAQANLGRVERLGGPSLVAIGRVPPRVLLIDDVATTGASLAAAARCLRLAGAERVDAAVVAAVRAPSGRVAPAP